MSIAKEIYRQLGGDRFAFMTNTRNFISDGNTLRMHLARNKSGANRLYITLNGKDLYDLKFFRYTSARYSTRGGQFREYPEKITVKAEYHDIFCDQLPEIFERTTGLYTRL